MNIRTLILSDLFANYSANTVGETSMSTVDEKGDKQNALFIGAGPQYQIAYYFVSPSKNPHNFRQKSQLFDMF